jgi:hypothetical protein
MSIKKGFSLVVAGVLGVAAYAQNMDELPRWSAELNVFGGSLQQTVTNINFVSAYPYAVNGNISNLQAVAGSSMGANAQLGYFIGKKRHFGISAGIMFSQQQYSLKMDTLHVEYKSNDYTGNVFRQVLTADGHIQENITATNINIPVLLKYQTKFSKKFGIDVDAGVLFNVRIMNDYKTNASFDYEAIYALPPTAGNIENAYDNAPTPNPSDWLITKSYLNATDKGNAASDFSTFRAQGFNVGLGVKPNHTSGSVPYNNGSIGFMAQPSLTYNIGRNLFLNLGFYYMMQNFTNNASNTYMTTNKVGDYSSVTNGVTKSQQTTYGGVLGLRFMFGGKKAKMDMAPTQMQDGNNVK